MSSARTPTALESLARLRTMRALLAGEDRLRFERLVADVEQAVWEMESVTLDLARLVATGITASPDLQPIELTGIVSGALRNIDGALASRGVLIDIVAPPAVFVLAEPERLEQLLSVALVVSAAAVSPRGHAALRYGPRDGRVVDCSIAPYSARDPRAVIVDALARALGIRLSATDQSLSLAMQAAVDVAPA